MTAGRMVGGRYRLDGLLGSGGMGAVWRGRDLRLDRPVAVKELTSAGLGFPRAIERFDREARAVARLAHPAIVAVYDVGTDGGHPYLVMELIEGRSVAAMLRDGPLPVASAVAIAAQVCDGLAAAHAAGVVHRDIKPANLLITAAGVVKICDFGIARLHDAAAETDLTGVAPPLGSYKYMAPEQAAGRVADARTDLYGLGCVLYAMLAGAPPFEGGQATVLHQHQTEQPAPLGNRRGDLPPALDALVQQLLRKNPAERPADAAEVKRRLDGLNRDPATGALGAALAPAIGGGLAPAAEAGPGPDRTRTNRQPAARRRAFALGTALLVALVLLAASGAALWSTAADKAADKAAAGQSPEPAAVSSPAEPAGVSSVPVEPAGTVIREPEATTLSRVPVANDDTVPTSRPRTPTASASPSPVDPIVAMRLSVKEQVDSGHLNPTKAPDLYKKVDEIAHALYEDDLPEATKKIQDMRDKLAELRRNGNLTATGYDRLVADLDRLAASVS